MPSLAAWWASSQARNSACDAKASTGCIARPIVHSKLMSKRLITALVAALALLVAAPAYAQKAAATASPGHPPASATESVTRISSDYRDSACIDVCTHARADLQ